MAQHNATEGYTIRTPNYAITSTFNSFAQLKLTLDHVALTESLFGSSELSPLSTPEPTPHPSPVQQAIMDLDSSDDGFQNPTPLNLEAQMQAPSSGQPTHIHRTYPLSPEKPAQASSSTQPMHLDGAERRRAKKKSQSHANRRKARQMAREATYANIKARPESTAKFVNSSIPIYTDGDMKNASRVNTGYTGRDGGNRSRKLHTLEELVGEGSKFGFKLQRWDGKTSVPILDSTGRLVAILVGQPADPQWPNLHGQGAAALERLRSHCFIPKSNCKPHRRGAFVALQCGVSHGGGQPAPKNLENHPKNEKVLNELNEMPFFQRVAGFASGAMATWAPALYKYYGEKLGALHDRDFTLHRVFSSSIFSATTYNFGPQTVCFKHKDFGNLAFGLCAITALGRFDPTRGGHLILWDLELVIEFPPGSTVLIASALIAHSNVLIGKEETRYSVAQYSAGALFRWVDNGFQRSQDFYGNLDESTRRTVEYLDGFHWDYGLSLLPIILPPKND